MTAHADLNRGFARARSDEARELASRALWNVRRAKLHLACVHVEEGLRKIEGAKVMYTSDEAALDHLIAAAAVVAEASESPRYAAIAPDARGLLARAVRLRLRLLERGR